LGKHGKVSFTSHPKRQQLEHRMCIDITELDDSLRSAASAVFQKARLRMLKILLSSVAGHLALPALPREI